MLPKRESSSTAALFRYSHRLSGLCAQVPSGICSTLLIYISAIAPSLLPGPGSSGSGFRYPSGPRRYVLLPTNGWAHATVGRAGEKAVHLKRDARPETFRRKKKQRISC